MHHVILKKWPLHFFLVLVIYSACWFCTQAPPEHYDVLIHNAKIVDGTGSPPLTGSVAINGERIAAVGKVNGDADIVIDGSGLVVSPGFIDSHSHADNGLMKYPRAENLVIQGITTVVAGQCGQSRAPQKDYTFHQYLSELEELGLSINYTPLVGHNTIRSLVMGQDFKRKATQEEIEKMKNYVEEAMMSGAFGLSAGLDYYPGEYAGEEEIVALARIAGQYGGLFFPHLRHRNSDWPGEIEEWKYGVYHGPVEDVWVGRYRGVWEGLEISRKAQVPLHIAHLCNIYRIPQPHPDFLEKAAAEATVWNITQAIEQGYDVTFDVIISLHDVCTVRPLVEEFIRSRTLALEPYRKLSKDEFIEKIKTKSFREEIRKIYDDNKLKFSVTHTKADPYWMDRFIIVDSQNDPYVGKTIAEIARSKETDPLEAIFDILVEDPDVRWFQYFDEKEVMHQTIPVFLNHSVGVPSTDMGTLPPLDNSVGFEMEGLWVTPSPVAYGGFADYIGTYVRERNSLSLEEAVRKATFFPAQRFGLKDRGRLRPDAFADVVVFDIEKIKMTGDSMKPAQRPNGIEYVLVNGKIVYKDKTHTGERPGHVLKHKVSE